MIESRQRTAADPATRTIPVRPYARNGVATLPPVSAQIARRLNAPQWLRGPLLPVASAAVAGVLLRAHILTGLLGIADSDEAVSGLVTRHFLDHPTRLPVFI